VVLECLLSGLLQVMENLEVMEKSGKKIRVMEVMEKSGESIAKSWKFVKLQYWPCRLPAAPCYCAGPASRRPPSELLSAGEKSWNTSNSVIEKSWKSQGNKNSRLCNNPAVH